MSDQNEVPTRDPQYSTPRAWSTAAEVRQYLGISESDLYRLDRSGQCPRPARFGRAVKWNLTELHLWIIAGKPDRSEWEQVYPYYVRDYARTGRTAIRELIEHAHRVGVRV